jgi:hypothetical protein
LATSGSVGTWKHWVQKGNSSKMSKSHKDDHGKLTVSEIFNWGTCQVTTCGDIRCTYAPLNRITGLRYKVTQWQHKMSRLGDDKQHDPEWLYGYQSVWLTFHSLYSGSNGKGDVKHGRSGKKWNDS